MVHAASLKRNNPKHKHIEASQIIIFLTLAILGLIMILPFHWSIVMSFTPLQQQENGFHLWFTGWTWDNWAALSKQNWWLYTFNTLLVAVGEIAFSLFFSTMAAYAFAKFEFPFKKFLYSIMLFSMMVPGIITLLPQFIVVTTGGDYNATTGIGPGLYNSLWAIILPQAVSIYGILFLRQFFVEQSDEIGEAARVDGANEFRIYLIYFRMALPGIITLGLFTFISTWNAYLWPSMVLNDRYTLAIALQEYQTTANTGEMMAASLLTIVPIIVLFIVTQKHFMNQVTYNGIK
jgi:multiple sugar transport system permease protein